MKCLLAIMLLFAIIGCEGRKPCTEAKEAYEAHIATCEAYANNGNPKCQECFDLFKAALDEQLRNRERGFE